MIFHKSKPRKRSRYKKTTKLSNPFERVGCYVPKSLLPALKALAQQYGVSVENMATRALTNAIKGFGSFNVDMSMGEALVNEITQADERKLYMFISGAKEGIPLDYLFLAHEDAGFISLRHLKETLELLTATGVLETFKTDDSIIPWVRVVTAVKKSKTRQIRSIAEVRVHGDKR